MKPLKPLFTLLAGLLMACNAKATELTIGEAFNLRVGDSLRYRYYKFTDYCALQDRFEFLGYNALKIISKTTHDDTLTYVVYLTSDNFFRADTILINNLDSPILSYTGILNPNIFQEYLFDAHVADTNALNYNFSSGFEMGGRISNVCYANFFESGREVTYVKNVGVFKSEYGGWGGGGNPFGVCSGFQGVRLMYFESDSVVWMDTSSFYYTEINEPEEEGYFKIYPNPTSNTLYVNTTEAYTTPVDINVYNVWGAKLRTYRKQVNQNEAIDIQELQSGAYFLEISDGKSRAIKKFVVER